MKKYLLLIGVLFNLALLAEGELRLKELHVSPGSLPDILTITISIEGGVPDYNYTIHDERGLLDKRIRTAETQVEFADLNIQIPPDEIYVEVMAGNEKLYIHFNEYFRGPKG